MSRFATGVVAGLLVLSPVAVWALEQSEQVDATEESEEAKEYRELLGGLLEERILELQEDGTEVELLELWVGTLSTTPEEGSSDATSIEFEEGGEYVVMAVCDDDCVDIDLLLTGPGGYEELDQEEDAEPVLVPGLFETLQAGEYTINLSMFDCQAAYCYFAVRIDKIQ